MNPTMMMNDKPDPEKLRNIQDKKTVEWLLEDFKNAVNMKDLVGKLVVPCKYILQIRGDGNCFYRAVCYHLLEKLLLKDSTENCINDFIKWLEEDIKKSQSWFYDFDEEICNFKEGYIKQMESVQPSVKLVFELLKKVKNISDESGDLDKKITLLKKLLNKESKKYDKNFILFLRFGIKTVVTRYRCSTIFRINGHPLRDSMAFDNNTYQNDFDKIIQKELMILGKDARDWMIEAAPTVIGANISVHYVDNKNCSYAEIVYKKGQGIQWEEPYLHKLFKNDTFYVLLKPGHYDALYSRKEIEKYPILDKIEPEKMVIESHEEEKKVFPVPCPVSSSFSSWKTNDIMKIINDPNSKPLKNEKIHETCVRLFGKENKSAFYKLASLLITNKRLKNDSKCAYCNNIGEILTNGRCYCSNCYVFKGYKVVDGDLVIINSCLHACKASQIGTKCKECSCEISHHLKYLLLYSKKDACAFCNNLQAQYTVCENCKGRICVNCLPNISYVENKTLKYLCLLCQQNSHAYEGKFVLICRCLNPSLAPQGFICLTCKCFLSPYAYSVSKYLQSSTLNCIECEGRLGVYFPYECSHLQICIKCARQ